MVEVICPVCGSVLTREKPAWHCENGHSFDVARQGYVNLLTVQQKHSLHPGDTAEMVLARRRFLESGHYRPIVKKLQELLHLFCPEAASVLDVGCGEGYYLSQLKLSDRWGIDISKDAVRYAAGGHKEIHFLTATASHLPFSENSFDALLSMFALTMDEEYARVLREKGIFIQVLAGESHLLGLKRIIYPAITEKVKSRPTELKGFTHIHSESIRFPFHLDNRQSVQDLLSMTPHLWRISKEGARALAETEQLTDEADVLFHVYCRHCP